jgi:hypothetical protein
MDPTRIITKPEGSQSVQVVLMDGRGTRKPMQSMFATRDPLEPATKSFESQPT